MPTATLSITVTADTQAEINTALQEFTSQHGYETAVNPGTRVQYAAKMIVRQVREDIRSYRRAQREALERAEVDTEVNLIDIA